jgi:hypothetical protein
MRSISESTTRLADPVRVGEDRIRAYQLRPIPGQLTLLVPRVNHADVPERARSWQTAARPDATQPFRR